MARHRIDKSNWRIGEGRAEDRPYKKDADGSAHELGEHIEAGVNRIDLAQSPEAERDSRVDVGARPFAPWRVNDADGRKPHGEAHQSQADPAIWYRLAYRRTAVFEQGAKRAGGDHERAQTPGFYQVFWPMLAQRTANREGGCSHAYPPVSNPG